jgi:nucleotide-binding universal stress UspA family protein
MGAMSLAATPWRTAMSHIKSILLHLDNAANGAIRLQAAQALAQELDAVVEARYAVTPVQVMYPYGIAAEVPMMALEEDLLKTHREVMAHLHAVASPTPPVTWTATTDLPVRGFVQHSWGADLLVLGQHAPETPFFSGVGEDFVPSVLIDSGKPAMVLPYIHQGAVKAQTVLVAWKSSPQAARAVSAALPWLQRAQQVHVAAWHDQAGEGSHTVLDIESWLRHHGVKAVVHHEAPAGRDLGAVMLSKAADVQADLLVMGCYGHSRMREWLLGGATRTVLRSMTLPVLMSH